MPPVPLKSPAGRQGYRSSDTHRPRPVRLRFCQPVAGRKGTPSADSLENEMPRLDHRDAGAWVYHLQHRKIVQTVLRLLYKKSCPLAQPARLPLGGMASVPSHTRGAAATVSQTPLHVPGSVSALGRGRVRPRARHFVTQPACGRVFHHPARGGACWNARGGHAPRDARCRAVAVAASL